MLGIILMTPLMTLANEDRDPASEIRRGALAQANGDTSQAFIVVSVKTAELLDGTNVTQSELELCKRANARFKEYYGYDERSWLRKSWDSDMVKVLIFISGIVTGTQVSKLATN